MSSSWFRITYAANAFRRSLAEAGVSLDGLRIAGATDHMLLFYRNARAQHTRLDDAEDTLRVSWSADDEGLAVVFSRRMQRTGNYVPLESLDLTLRYVVDGPLGDLASGELILTHPDDAGAFKSVLKSSELYAALVRRRPVSVGLDEISGPR